MPWALGVTWSPKRVRNTAAILPNDRPNCLLRLTASAIAWDPTCTRGGAVRIAGLERMPSLHAPVAGVALAHVDVKAPHDRRDRGQVFLILRGDMGLTHRAATAGTGRGHRHVVRLMHDGRDRALPAATIRRAPLAPRAARSPFRHALRERRRLARARAARRLQFVFQPRVFPFEARPLRFELRALVLKSRACPGESMILEIAKAGGATAENIVRAGRFVRDRRPTHTAIRRLVPKCGATRENHFQHGHEPTRGTDGAP